MPRAQNIERNLQKWFQRVSWEFAQQKIFLEKRKEKSFNQHQRKRAAQHPSSQEQLADGFPFVQTATPK